MVPGDVFGSEGDHYIRMSFANSYENVVEGCKRLKGICGEDSSKSYLKNLLFTN